MQPVDGPRRAAAVPAARRCVNTGLSAANLLYDGFPQCFPLRFGVQGVLGKFVLPLLLPRCGSVFLLLLPRGDALVAVACV
jgi:hypothetical protein